jgi:SAM-dependent methyltransferase
MLTTNQLGPMSTLACPICTHASGFERRCRDADLYRCSECDHCFSDLSSLRAVEEYRPDYFEKNWFQRGNTQLFEAISKAVAGHKEDASVLDAGCGNGAFLRYLHNRHPGMSLTGVDLSRNEPQRGIKFVQGDITSLELSGQFDVIVSLAVIEHIADVRAFVRRLYSLCAPNGLVIVMTMNDRSILYGVARLFKRVGFGLPADQLYSSHHLNHFNIKSLQTLMSSFELHPDHTIRHNIPLSAVDISSQSRLLAPLLRQGVLGIFILGSITGSTYLQTVICRKPR